MGNEYRAYLGVAFPMKYIRDARKQYGYTFVTLKTSNLFSRISQSNFNWKSISELSIRLGVTRNQYHLFSYIIAKFIENEAINLNDLGEFLKRQAIIPGDLDRIIRYNCISSYIDKILTSRRKTILRKILNGKKSKKGCN